VICISKMCVRLLGFAFVAWLAAAIGARAANSQADFAGALASAQAAEAEAGALKNQWTPTEDALAAAKKAAAAGDFDTAVREARRAEALAKASIAQAKEQQEAWKAAVIH
jgi:erythromycin esterase-like protein